MPSSELQRTWPGTVVVFLVFLVGMAYCADEPAPDAQKPQIDLKIAICLDKPKLTLAFMAKNTGTNDIKTTAIFTQRNCLVVIKPDGEKIEYSYEVEQKPVVIKPMETKVWEVNPNNMGFLFKTPGLYNVSWSVNGVQSPAVVVLKEAEREEKP